MGRLHLAVLGLLVASPASADDLFVGGGGDPYSAIQDALDAARAGDVVIVRAGTYSEALSTGTGDVTLRADAGASVVVETSGRVLHVQHGGFTVQGLALDGQFGDRDAVNVESGADGFTMRDVEVRNSGRDCVDMGSVTNVLIERSVIHHCLNSSSAGCSSDGCRVDAHGITGASVREVTIRDTEIHTFSGDAIQFDPGRSDPGWNDVTLERVQMWLEPLPSAVGGFAAGVVPGENAIDTKTSDTIPTPARLTIIDTVARGFRNGLISNMAAFNLKENVEARLDRVTVSDCEIAFRLRGATSSRPRGAQVTLYNAVVFDVDTAVRYEDGIGVITLYNSTLGGDIGRAFNDQSSGGSIDGRNVAVLGGSLPSELDGVASNLALPASAFADAAMHDYHLPDGSPAIDVGEMLAEVALDRDGNARPQGGGWDVGAYESCGGMCVEVDAGPPPGRDAGPTAGRDGSTPPGTDAGATTDPPTGGSDDGGCGCGVGGEPSAPALVTLVVLWLLVRRRRGTDRRPRS